MAQPPIGIKAIPAERVLQISWTPQFVVRLGLKDVRCACTCAGCVHEFTGERLLDPATVPEDISIRKLELAGNYALKIAWSDGHDSGLFTWEHLSRLAPQQC